MLESLEHFEIGGKPNQYLNGITYDGGIAIFACHGLGKLPTDQLEQKLLAQAYGKKVESEYDGFEEGDGEGDRLLAIREESHKLKIRKLRFEYCGNIGDIAIQAMIRAFAPTLESFEMRRTFSEGANRISDVCFDLDCEIKHSRKRGGEAEAYATMEMDAKEIGMGATKQTSADMSTADSTMIDEKTSTPNCNEFINAESKRKAQR